MSTAIDQVEVEGLSCVEGGSSAFLAEAQGGAAKGWLLVHGGNWRKVLSGQGKSSAAFVEGSNSEQKMVKEAEEMSTKQRFERLQKQLDKTKLYTDFIQQKMTVTATLLLV
jgi:hypothetical protein